MATQTRSLCLSLVAAEAITKGQLIYVDSTGKWAVATASTAAPDAVALDTVASAATVGGEQLIGGTMKMIANGAITAFSKVYAANAGKISSTAGGAWVGVAQEAATTDGDVIEVLLPTLQDLAQHTTYRAFTADGSVTLGMAGGVYTNLGASGTVVVSLPTGVPAGTRYTFVVQAAQAFRIDPGASDAIIAGGTVNADGKYLWADDEGETVTLVADTSNNWIAVSLTGTWTIEP